MKESAKAAINISVRPPFHDHALSTRASLLARLKDWKDQPAWQEFFDVYWDLIYRVAIKAGLNETEAQDAVQETLLAVAQNIKTFQYNPARCSFKSWLLLITRQRIVWQFRKRLPVETISPARDDISHGSAVDQLPDPNSLALDATWEEEWQRHALSAALLAVRQKVSSRQFQIFDLHVLQNWSAVDVAATLGISKAQVYLAKHRVSAVLKKQLRHLEFLDASLAFCKKA